MMILSFVSTELSRAPLTPPDCIIVVKRASIDEEASSNTEG